MKKTFIYFLAAATVGLMATSCNNEPPYVDPYEGDLELTGAFITNTHDYGSGWQKNDKIGVFVTSKGLPQNNLLYTPSAYFAGGDDVGNVALNAGSEKAAFKLGDHTIYAYCPYVDGDFSLNQVPVPDVSVQSNEGFLLADETMYKEFAYAKKSVSTYGTDAIDLGEFKSMCTGLSTSFDIAASAEGEVVKTIEIEADFPLAYKDATFNLETEKFEGTELKKITLTVTENGEIEGHPFFGVSTSNIAVLLMVPFEKEFFEKDGNEFTITITTVTNKKFGGKGKICGGTHMMGNLISPTMDNSTIGVLQELK